MHHMRGVKKGQLGWVGHIVITHLHPWFVVIIPTSVWRSKTRTGRVIGDRERQPEKWEKEGGTKRRLVVCPTDCRLPPCAGYCNVDGSDAGEWVGLGGGVDKGDSTLKPTKLQKQWILNSRLNSWVYVKNYCIIILDLSPMGRRVELEQQGTSEQSSPLW